MSYVKPLVTCVAPLTLCCGVAQAQTAESSESGLKEIVVTAQKKSENLQQVPISITALTAEAISTNRIQNASDIGNFAPNVTVKQSIGGSLIPSFTIRGVAAANANGGADNGVSLYVDGVYVGRAAGATFDTADIERIEVLRGPQGTLFGRNATGGAVSLVTATPKGVLALHQENTIGNYAQFRNKTRLDLPEWNNFSASVTYLHLEREGEVRNLGAGRQWDYSSASDGQFGTFKAAKTLGAANTDAVNVSVRYNPDKRFDLIYRFDYTDARPSPAATATLGYGPAASGGGLAQLILESQPGGVPVFVTKRPDATDNGFTSRIRQKVQGHSLTGTFNITDGLQFKDIVAFRKSHVTSINQIDGAGGLTVQPAFDFLCGGPACDGDPFLLLTVSASDKYRQFSNEAQLSYQSELFDAIGGFYHFSDHSVTGGLGTTQALVLTAAPGNVIPGSPLRNPLYKSQSDALFGQVTVHLGERVDIVGGLRQTWDKKRATDYTDPSDPTQFRANSDKLTYLVNVNYRPTDLITAYAKYSTGFISGGQQNGVIYQAETAKSAEGGIKADLFDRHLRTNLAGFYVDYGNLQFPTFDNGIGIVRNAGKSRAYGFELETTLVPTDELTIAGNVGYTNFKYTELDPAVGNIDTYRPNYRPKWTASAAIDYRLPVRDEGLYVLLHADTNYHSRYSTIPDITGATIPTDTSPATWLVNGRVALMDIPMAGARGQIGVWGKNLTNRRVLTYTASLGLVYGAIFEQARTYGLDVTFDF